MTDLKQQIEALQKQVEQLELKQEYASFKSRRQPDRGGTAAGHYPLRAEQGDQAVWIVIG